MIPEFSKEEQKKLRAMGTVLKRLRKNAGYETQEEFSDFIKMNRSQYQEYESGVNMKTISIDRLVSHHNITGKEFTLMVYDEMDNMDNKQIRKIS